MTKPEEYISSVSGPVLDLGCGENKHPGAVGIDRHKYDGVDIVFDLNYASWPLASESFNLVLCRHVFEHVRDPAAFMGEIHRVAAPSALVLVETPHFSSLCSWLDPTHTLHLSIGWPRVFEKDGYLSRQSGEFEIVDMGIKFGKTLRGRIGLLVSRLVGPARWESWVSGLLPCTVMWHVLRVMK